MNATVSDTTVSYNVIAMVDVQIILAVTIDNFISFFLISLLQTLIMGIRLCIYDLYQK